jgi:hypothetical protein
LQRCIETPEIKDFDAICSLPRKMPAMLRGGQIPLGDEHAPSKGAPSVCDDRSGPSLYGTHAAIPFRRHGRCAKDDVRCVRAAATSIGNSEDLTMKTGSPTSQTEQDAKAQTQSGKPATEQSSKPASGQHAANHTRSGKDHGAGGGAKQRHGPR